MKKLKKDHVLILTSMSGDSGTSMSGYNGTSMSGYNGTSMSGDNGTSMSGENGLKPDTPYRLKKRTLFLTAIILLLLGNSCTHQKYISKNKDKICHDICLNEIIVKYDSIYVETIDTIYKVQIFDSIHFVTVFKNDTIKIVDKSFNVKIWQENELLHAEIKHVSEQLKIEKSKKKEIIKEVDKVIKIEEKYIPKFWKWTFGISLVIILGLILWLLWRFVIKRQINKFLKEIDDFEHER